MNRPSPSTTGVSAASLSARHWIGVGLGALLTTNALVLFVSLFFHIQTRHDLTSPEGAVVRGAWHAARGLAVYGDWRAWPHQFTPYGPALYYPIGWLARALGGADYGMHFYLLGRAQSLAALLGIGAMSALLAMRVGCSRRVAFVCGFTLFSLWAALPGHVVSYRPDAPMVFWSLLAVWLALGGLSTRRRRWAVLGALWLALAYKHAAWSAPLVVAWLAWRSLGRDAVLRWGALFVLGPIMATALMEAFNDGHFLLNTVWGLDNGWSVPELILRRLRGPFTLWIGPLIRGVGLLAGGAWLVTRKGGALASRALGLYFISATALCVLQSFKTGADVNYALEPYALSGVGAAMLWLSAFDGGSNGLVRTWRRTAVWGATGLVAWLAAVALAENTTALVHSSKLSGRRFPIERLMQHRGRFLLMDRAFIHPDPEAHALDDPTFYGLMTDRGRIPREPLLERLAEHEFDLIALSPVGRAWFFEHTEGGWPGVALERAYTRVPNWPNPEIWRPKRRQNRNLSRKDNAGVPVGTPLTN